jgi:PAP2 superfamily
MQPPVSGAHTTVAGQTVTAGGRSGDGTAAQPRRVRKLARLAAIELAIWASLYGLYLVVRGLTIGNTSDALAHASDVVWIEQSVGVFHEAALQSALQALHEALSAYYMLGFAPLIAAVLVWLALSRPADYRELRTVLLVSIALATIVFVLFPTAPPRLVPELGIADTVGLSGHDSGSFAGIRFNPYAAVPSMHVGWSLLVGLYGIRVASTRIVRFFFVAHPAVMVVAVTATGNHYFLDSLAGIAVALAGLTLVRSTPRIVLPRPMFATYWRIAIPAPLRAR